MESYKEALAAYLKSDGSTQAALADAISKTQAAVSRYATGERFPDSKTARDIDEKTNGAVPLTLWQREAAQRIGLDVAA